MTPEPKEAFPYKPPSAEILQKYPHVFKLTQTLPPRFFKVLFDKSLALILLLLSAPLLLLLKMAFLIEGLLIPENKGPMFFYYNGVSAGKIIPKYKIRLIKSKYIEPEGAKRHDWIAYSAEWIQKLPVGQEMLYCGLNRALDISPQIGAGQINRIYKKIARKAGLDESAIEGISGHSMRVGAAQDLLNSGASMPIIMQRGRWSKTDTVMRYVEHIVNQ